MIDVTAYAPGRVNLIGDHTDYTGGLVLPMAIDRGTTVTFTPGGDEVVLVSDVEDVPARVALDVADPAVVEPHWARYVAGIVAAVRPAVGGHGRVVTTLPIGAGLSSSAALEVALALALGVTGSTVALARLCQGAEQAASGVPCGVMDQLTSAAGQAGHALLIDCSTLDITAVPLPDGAAVVVVPSGETRALAGSAYAARRQQCEVAAGIVGPLRTATPGDLAAIEDAVVQRRARHVVTENARVATAAAALRAGDLAAAGQAMTASHQSLRDDFEVSTPALDELVDALSDQPGVHGARLTGAGFGGCAVALVDATAATAVVTRFGGFVAVPSAGASRR